MYCAWITRVIKQLPVATKFFSNLSHYFAYLYENYIVLPPCQSRSSGQTLILSSSCIVRRLPESTNSYMWLRSTFFSYPTTFLTCKRTISSCLPATVEVVDGPKSYQVVLLCIDNSSHQTVTCGYEVLFKLILLLSLFVRELFHRFHATVEVVDRPKSYQVDVLCVDYPSHQTITCGYEVLFYLIPLLSLLVRELYHLVSLPR
jgi:hypothetical protein